MLSKGGLDGSTSTIGSQNSRGTTVKHTPTKSPIKAFEDIASSISKTRGKRKINMGGVIDDDGCENDGDQHDLDTDVDDEWGTKVEDFETSDEEWVSAKAKVAECKRQKVLGRTNTPEEVGKQDMDKAKSATAGNKQTHLGSSLHSNYETSKAEMDTDRETDDEVPRLLRKKERPVKVDEHTNLKN
ncbi:hypothetical protein Cgig2_027289 [Carnegiea gigantea]|uniref:Uncharacterized protein n=1 Tax=Carnegiea gigantea TaxID=171969 RepID=A0A9Q1K384_9CARY|nr:hypothetical protein Cgig2_027289 [Carnegiea gigantea]